jgi:uncharacterized protein (DUF2062 family)
VRRFFRYYRLRLKRLQGDPKIIARGIGVGLFVGITPTIPVHTVLLLALCYPLRASKIAAFLAAWIISNPLTIFLQYYLCWRIGSLFFPGLLSWGKIQNVLETLSQGQGYEGFRQSIIPIGGLGFDAGAVMLTGGVVLATPFAFIGYYYSLKFFIKRRNKLSKK